MSVRQFDSALTTLLRDVVAPGGPRARGICKLLAELYPDTPRQNMKRRLSGCDHQHVDEFLADVREYLVAALALPPQPIPSPDETDLLARVKLLEKEIPSYRLQVHSLELDVQDLEEENGLLRAKIRLLTPSTEASVEKPAADDPPAAADTEVPPVSETKEGPPSDAAKSNE